MEYINFITTRLLILSVVIKVYETLPPQSKLEKLFMGRCWEYQYKIAPELFSDRTRNCTDLWDKFSSAFLHKGPCNTSRDAFSDLILAGSHNIANNSAIFWSGVYPWITEYAELSKTYKSLEETLLGYVLNNLKFCSTVQDPGITDQCAILDQESCDNSKSAYRIFWKEISLAFSSRVRGDVAVILNASIQAFRETSTFGGVELPNLLKGNVSKITVLLAHKFNDPINETCESGSLNVLRDRVKAKGVEFQCEENPREVVHYFCANNQYSKNCIFVNEGVMTRSHNIFYNVMIVIYVTCYLYFS